MKRAQIEVEIVAAFVIVLLMLILFLALGAMDLQAKKLTAVKVNMNKDFQLTLLLSTEMDGAKIEEHLLHDYYIGDFENSENIVKETLKQAFNLEQDPCFRILIDGKTMINSRSNCIKLI